MNLCEVVIVAGARTPIGSFGGSLKDISSSDLGAMAVREAVKRAKIKISQVDEVIVGQVGQIAEDGFIGRLVSLKAGLPESVTAYSVNRQCGSGLQAIANGMMEIQTGKAEIVVACGTENITRLPYYINDARWGARMGHKQMEDGVTSILTWPLGPFHNGITAENVAARYGVSREAQDTYALESHRRAIDAIENGKFKDEIFPIELKDRKGNVTIFNTDEGPRKGLTIEKLQKLKPCFITDGTGTVTPGNASSLNDGAAAVVLMSKEKAKSLGYKNFLTIRDFVVTGCDADVMGYAPKYSSEKLAKKLSKDLNKIDMIEINEAFASQTVAVIRDLGLDAERVNIYGGGISIGHPIGATGCILAVKVLYELLRTEKKDALISMCIGGGQGISMYFAKNQ